MNDDLMTRLKESERGSPDLDVEMCVELGLVPAGTEPHDQSLTGYHHEQRPAHVWKLTTDVRDCVHFLHGLTKQVDWDLSYGRDPLYLQGTAPSDAPWFYFASVGYANEEAFHEQQFRNPELVCGIHPWPPLAMCIAILHAREEKRL